MVARGEEAVQMVVEGAGHDGAGVGQGVGMVQEVGVGLEAGWESLGVEGLGQGAVALEGAGHEFGLVAHGEEGAGHEFGVTAHGVEEAVQFDGAVHGLVVVQVEDLSEVGGA